MIYICIINSSTNSCAMKKSLFSKIKNVKIVSYDSIPITKNNKYYFMKHITPNIINIIKKLRQNNNYIYYEPLDYNWNKFDNIDTYVKEMNKIFIHFNHIIFNNKYMSTLFNNDLQSSCIYHEYDTRYKCGDKTNNIFYIGGLLKCSLTNDIMKKYNIKHIQSCKNNNLHKLSYCGIHINYVLPDKVNYHIHTSTKLSTAILFKSIFICNKIPIYLEILGKDYEYYINDDLSNMDNIIKKALDVLNNNNEYNLYLSKMNKRKLSPDSIRKSYSKVFNG